MRFTKMHGCGNDYIYIDCSKETVTDAEAPKLAVRLSDRHTGIGGDGIVLIKPSDKADFFMDMYNLDGSRGRMCGNAIRCVGKYVYEHGLTDKLKLDIDTLSGIKHLTLHHREDGPGIADVTVDMGSPITDISLIPLNTDIIHEYKTGYILGALARAMEFTFVSMGNPHAVTFVDDIFTAPVTELGPEYEHHAIFPEQANIEFVHVIDRTHIEFRVWERGSGETRACGTGACASAYACILNGFTEDDIEVKMLGGTLHIRFDRELNRIFMTGPATEVFTGVVF